MSEAITPRKRPGNSRRTTRLGEPPCDDAGVIGRCRRGLGGFVRARGAGESPWTPASLRRRGASPQCRPVGIRSRGFATSGGGGRQPRPDLTKYCCSDKVVWAVVDKNHRPRCLFREQFDGITMKQAHASDFGTDSSGVCHRCGWRGSVLKVTRRKRRRHHLEGSFSRLCRECLTDLLRSAALEREGRPDGGSNLRSIHDRHVA